MICLAGRVSAQSMSSKMQETEKACMHIKTAMAEKSAEKMMVAMEMLSEIPLKDLNLIPLNTEHQVSLKGHLQFNTTFLDSLLLHNLDFSLVQIEESFKMRGGEGALRCTHYAVAPQSSVCYQMKAQGEQELLVIPEDKGLINLYVKDTANDILLEDVAAEGKQVCKLKWNIDKVSSLEIRIENKSDIPVSFIVVSN